MENKEVFEIIKINGSEFRTGILFSNENEAQKYIDTFVAEPRKYYVKKRKDNKIYSSIDEYTMLNPKKATKSLLEKIESLFVNLPFLVNMFNIESGYYDSYKKGFKFVELKNAVITQSKDKIRYTLEQAGCFFEVSEKEDEIIQNLYNAKRGEYGKLITKVNLISMQAKNANYEVEEEMED